MRAAEIVVEQCDADPIDNADPNPKLFSDLEDKSLHDSLFDLWQKGVLDAEWDDGDQETKWWLTEFGVELCERDLVEYYVRAVDEDIRIDTAQPTLLDPLEAGAR